MSKPFQMQSVLAGCLIGALGMLACMSVVTTSEPDPAHDPSVWHCAETLPADSHQLDLLLDRIDREIAAKHARLAEGKQLELFAKLLVSAKRSALPVSPSEMPCPPMPVVEQGKLVTQAVH